MYVPGPVLDPNFEAFRQYVSKELEQISIAFAQTLQFPLEELHNAPTKPRTGMIVLADGTNWNPGSGRGVYAYYGGAWNFLG